MGGGMAGALALTRLTVMRLMLVLYGGCAGAYPPYGDEVNFDLCRVGKRSAPTRTHTPITSPSRD